MSRFIEVPARMLPPETLTALLEAFVTRQGYDTTARGAPTRYLPSRFNLPQSFWFGADIFLHASFAACWMSGRSAAR